MNYRITSISVLIIIFFTGCGTYFNQPVKFTNARIGEVTTATERLQLLPEPKEKVVVGVYNFRDLTGQYKASDVGSTFSTAVTQGSTAILIEALENSGWFTTIERENIGNLLNERNIIRSTRNEYQGSEANKPQVPPLLFAGVLLEGGIVSYDHNIVTGGAGARYFGAGGSTQYRQDRVTVYLRAISTSSGKILKNIYVSKTVLSQALDASLFKYVKFQRLMEAEVGFTRNEPVQLAVKEAIEKAVEGLIIEGLEDKIWAAEDEKKSEEVISAYKTEKSESELNRIYNRHYVSRAHKGSFGLNVGGSLISGDYSYSELAPSIKVEYSAKLSNAFFLNIAGNGFELSNGSRFKQRFVGGDINAGFLLLPNDVLSPYVYGGGGYIFNVDKEEIPDGMDDSFFKLQYGMGLEYLISKRIGFKIFAEHNLSFSDRIDFLENGKRDDHYFNFGVGLNFNIGVGKNAEIINKN